MESLENRELLSVSVEEFNALRLQYAELSLAESLDRYNIIEITTEQLHTEYLQAAINSAAQTEQDDLIVVRTDTNRSVIDLNEALLVINVDSAQFGNVAIIASGREKLQILGSSEAGVLAIESGNVALGGIVLESTNNFLHIDNVLRTAEEVTLVTSQHVWIVERDSRPGNYSILGEELFTAAENDFGDIPRYYGIPGYNGMSLKQIYVANCMGMVGVGPGYSSTPEVQAAWERFANLYLQYVNSIPSDWLKGIGDPQWTVEDSLKFYEQYPNRFSPPTVSDDFASISRYYGIADIDGLSLKHVYETCIDTYKPERREKPLGPWLDPDYSATPKGQIAWQQFDELMGLYIASLKNPDLLKTTEPDGLMPVGPGPHLLPDWEGRNNALDSPTPQAAGSLIGSKTYDIIIGVGGSLEAYLTGLSLAEKNAIVGGSLAFLNNLNPYDAEKTGSGDSDLCWAATSANMLAFTNWGNVGTFQTEDDILSYFNSHFTDAGSQAYFGNEWFLTGNYQRQGTAWANEGWAQVNSPGGGFYPSATYTSVAGLVGVSSVNSLTSAVDSLKDGAAVGLGIGWYDPWISRDGGHALTVWGAVYDTSKSKLASDYYVSLLLSDSDDHFGGGANAPNVLKSLNIVWAAQLNAYHFTTYTAGGGYWTAYLENFSWLAKYDPPAVPTNFHTTSTASNSVTLAWNVVNNVTGYQIQYKRSVDSTWMTVNVSGGSTATSTIASLMTNTAYDFQIRAVNGSTASDWSWLATAFAGYPSVTVTNQVGSVKLNWTATSGADRYEVLRQNPNGSWTTLASNVQSLQYIDTTATIGVATSYIVRACRNTAESGFAIVYGTAKLGVPQLTVTNQPGSVKVEWTAIAEANRYEVLRQNPNGSWTLIVDTTGLQITDTGMSIGVPTGYTVRAYKGTFMSDCQLNIYGTAQAGLGTPQVTRTNLPCAVQLDWRSVAEADRYEVLRQNPNGSWTTLASNVQALQYIDTTATIGSPAGYIVRAYKGSIVSGFNIVYGTAQPLGIPQVIVTNQVGSVKLAWDVITGADKYEILRQNSNGSWTSLDDTTTLQYIDTTAPIGVATSYIVRAYKGAIVSGFTIVYGKAQPLGIPQVIVTNQVGSVKLDWGTVAEADRYEVLRQNPDGSWTTLASNVQALQYIDTTATIGVATSYIVRAYKGAMVSGFTIVYGKAQLGIPQVIVTNQVGSVKLDWGTVAEADRYEVLRQNPDGSWTALASNVQSLQYIDTTATIGSPAGYIVRAYKGAFVSGFTIVYGKALP